MECGLNSGSLPYLQIELSVVVGKVALATVGVDTRA